MGQDAFRTYYGRLGSLEIIDEVFLTAQSWTPQLDRAGNWTAVVSPRDPHLPDLLNEWETVVYFARGDDPPFFAGVVESPTWADGQWTVQGPELTQYLDRVFLHDDRTFVAAEQFLLATAILNAAPDLQATTVYNPGLLTGGFRDLSWTAGQLTSVLAQLQKLAAFDNGFDFSLVLDWAGKSDAGKALVSRAINLWYPLMGLPREIVWEHGKAITITQVTRDGSQRSQKVWCPGASTTSTPALGSAVGPLKGPLLEMTLPQKDTASVSSLNAAAAAAADRNKAAHLILTADIDVTHPDAKFGTWQVGDIIPVLAADVDLTIAPDQFRLTAATFTVADDGEVTVTGATLTELLPGDPIFSPDGYRDLRALGRRIRTLESNVVAG